jgi:hypothetical protein
LRTGSFFPAQNSGYSSRNATMQSTRVARADLEQQGFGDAAQPAQRVQGVTQVADEVGH